MDRRALPIAVIGVVVVGAGLLALGTGLSGTASGPVPTANASVAPGGSPVALATFTASPSTPVPSALAVPSPTPSCEPSSRLVAVRAVAPDSGFPVKVAWIGLGPPDDLFLTLSDVAPTIPIAPSGPASLNVGLAYATGRDNFAFTAGSLTLTYDATTGRVSGQVATGYGKNSNRATKDAQPSQFEGVLTRATSATTNGLLAGRIAHAARTFEFKVEMTEKTVVVASGPGCAAARPTDSTPAP